MSIMIVTILLITLAKACLFFLVILEMRIGSKMISKFFVFQFDPKVVIEIQVAEPFHKWMEKAFLCVVTIDEEVMP